MLRLARTEYGALQGTSCGDPRVTVFKGVPYAAPPIGPFRWRAPQPCERWSGIRKADRFAPISIQAQPGLDWTAFYTKELHPTGDELAMSEDCLYLNIWTPAKAAGEALPVLFYIHGGALLGGYSYEMEFDGECVARKGCILVTAGYRLGALGFFAHEDLSRDEPSGSQGNFGFLDQLAALKWVRRNISAFGGNPERITIAGQSAGAGSVTALLCSPLIEDMACGAIMMSGGGPNTVSDFSIPLEEAQCHGAKLLETLGVDTVEEARRLPGEVICATYANMPRVAPGFPRCPTIVVDHVFMARNPLDVMKGNALPPIQYMVGACHDEGRGFYTRANNPPLTKEGFESHIRKEYGRHADAFLAAAHVQSDKDLPDLYNSEDYHVFVHAHQALVTLLNEQDRPVYVYTFDHDVPGGDQAGSYHGSDLWFFFDSLNRSWRPFTGKHYDLARQVCSYLVNFARGGDPNGTDANGEKLPSWERATAQRRMQMRFGENPMQEERGTMSGVMRLRVEKLLNRLER